MEQIPVTKQGFEKLEAELKNLKSVLRPAVIQAIAEAREHGDRSAFKINHCPERQPHP